MNDHVKLLGDAIASRPAPPHIAGLHPVIGSWHREGPWIRGSRRGTFQACYSRSVAESTERRHPVVDAAVIRDESAVSWVLERARPAFARSTRAAESSRSLATGTAEPVGP